MTNKRRSSFDDRQMSLGFEVTKPPKDGALEGMDRQVAAAVALMLSQDGRSRYEIAGGVSGLLQDDVSKLMLDAYASEARDTHNISAARLFAVVAETQRYDILRVLLAKIGVDIVVGEEIATLRLGHIRRQQELLAREEAELRKIAPLVQHGRRGRK
jgi:hypothetical protein